MHTQIECHAQTDTDAKFILYLTNVPVSKPCDTRMHTHTLENKYLNNFKLVLLRSDLQTHSRMLRMSMSLWSSDFLVHRETGLQRHSAPHTAEGHRFYVPCMQLINFCYFVVRACPCMCAYICTCETDRAGERAEHVHLVNYAT